MMLITLDNLAHRYQCLPSEALSRATTFDLYVLDVSTKWLRYQQDKADGRNPTAKQPSQEEMLTMLKRARGEL
jgi:hypothetical protein